MSETKPPFAPPSATDLNGADNASPPLPPSHWPVWKLALLFYPFTVAAVAINLFMLGLIAQVFDASTLSPVAAIIWSIPLGIPAAWAAGRWIHKLMVESDPKA